MTTGIELIAKERERQIKKEGWSEEHDNEHVNGELADAALCYIMGSPDITINIGNAYTQVEAKKAMWPWHIKWFKPSRDNRIKELIKAGALIAAEIDRLQNAEK